MGGAARGVGCPPADLVPEGRIESPAQTLRAMPGDRKLGPIQSAALQVDLVGRVQPVEDIDLVVYVEGIREIHNRGVDALADASGWTQVTRVAGKPPTHDRDEPGRYVVLHC